ncbi:MAG: helix-turn-helix domain-containing protein, partial [Phycisphaerales bacterium JB064]
YPGNVRELQNIVERAAVLTRSPTIQLHDLPPQVIENATGVLTPAPLRAAAEEEETPWIPMPLADALREPERRIILKALKANDWNRQQTADDLGINRTTLYKKMKALGLDDPTD